MDVALLTSAVISGLIALFIALISSEDFEEHFYINPLLRPLKNVRQSLTSHGSHCPSCPEEYVDPYARITLRRIELGANLGVIALGLIAQAVILLINQSITAAISYSIWAMLPAYLVFRYVIGLADVFTYWSNWLFRPALAMAALTIGVIGAENPYFLDIIGWVVKPQALIVVGKMPITSAVLAVAAVAIFAAFVIVRFLLNNRAPSLKTRLIRALKTSRESKTAKEWQKIVDPKSQYPNMSEEAIVNVLRELVYQNKAQITMEKRTAEPKYGPT